jgi:TonB family protein
MGTKITVEYIQRYSDFPEDRRFAAFYSVAAHLLIIAIFILIKIMSPAELPPVEIELMLGDMQFESPQTAMTIAAPSAAPILEAPTPIIQPSMAEPTKITVPKNNQPAAVTQNSAPDKMLPIFNDEDAVKASGSDKAIASDNASGKPSFMDSEKQPAAVTGSSTGSGNKKSANIGKDDVGNKAAPGTTGSPSGGNNYLLEGLSKDRKPIYEILPPSSMVKSEAHVKISFSVLSDGSISNINLIKKGDPELDALTIEYFRKWKFNQATDNQTQQGSITFIYKLK